MRTSTLTLAACTLLLGCGHRAAWDVKGAGLRSLVGKELLRACSDGQAEDCFALASRLEQINADSPEQRQALYHLHLLACEQGHPGACTQLGYRHVYGEGPDLDPARSHAALEAACEGGHGGACHVSGACLDEGRLGEPNERRAYELFLKGCEADDPRSCAWVGLKLEFGRGTGQDRGKAFPFFDKACELGEHPIGCFNAALHLAEAPEEEQDLELITSLMQAACDAGNEIACENVIILQEHAAAAAKAPEAEAGEASEEQGEGAAE
jgi:TPR repeat protein